MANKNDGAPSTTSDASANPLDPFGLTDGMAMLGSWSVGPFGWWNAADSAKPASSPMEMWISMFPTSPLFGVRWVWQDMATGMNDMAASWTGGLAAFGAPTEVTKALAASSRDEAAKLKSPELEQTLKASLKGKAKAKQIVEQGDEENATVTLDVKKTVAATKAKPKPKARKVEAEADAEARAAAEKAALDNVGVGALADLSAVGGVAAAFSADLGDSDPKKKADLRVVGGSDAVAPAADEAPKPPRKPKGLLSKEPAKVDDLKLIRGVGPRLEKLLNEAGVYQFKQIAKFTDADFAWLDEELSTFKGRALRDKWRDQAVELMKG